MKECNSNRHCIFAIIGILAVLISAAALIFIYHDRIRNFFSKIKTFFADLKDNIIACPPVGIEKCDFCDEYEDFADIWNPA